MDFPHQLAGRMGWTFPYPTGRKDAIDDSPTDYQEGWEDVFPNNCQEG